MITANANSMKKAKHQEGIETKLEELRHQLESESHITQRQILLRAIWRLENCQNDKRQNSLVSKARDK